MSTKMKGTYVTSIAAPDLLELVRDNGKSAFLRQRKCKKSGKEDKWNYCFAVLVNTALYIYDDETSKRSRDCISLVGYNCVWRIKSENCLFGFAFGFCNPEESPSGSTSQSSFGAVKSSRPETAFACSSDCDRRSWMRSLREHLYTSNNIPSPDFMFGSVFIEDESEYLSIEEPIDLVGATSRRGSKGSNSHVRGSSSRRSDESDLTFRESR